MQVSVDDTNAQEEIFHILPTPESKDYNARTI